MLVTAPGIERPRRAERFDREIADPVAGLGPLRGVLTAMENATTEIVVVATVAVLSWVAMSKVMPPAGAGSDELTVKVNIVVLLLPSFAETSLTLSTGLSSF